MVVRSAMAASTTAGDDRMYSQKWCSPRCTLGEADLLGQHRLVDQAAMPLGGRGATPRDRVGDQVSQRQQADIVTHAPHCGPTEAFNASRQFPGERSAPQVIGSEYRALFPPAGRHPAAEFSSTPTGRWCMRERQRAATLVRCSGSSRRTPPSSGRQTAGSSAKSTRLPAHDARARRYRY